MRLESSATNLIMWLTGQASVYRVIISVFADLVVIFVCFPVHECAHALAAKLCGDDTAERRGRLTLNPFAHIDWIGALLIFICNIGYAKPTPISLERCKKVSIRTANVLISLAGPLSNLVMSFILLIPYRILDVQLVNAATAEQAEVIFWAALAFYYAAQINVYLTIFNLIPIPPFDGYHILATFLPAKSLNFMERNARIFHVVFILLVFSQLLDIPLSIATDAVLYVLQLPLFFIS